MSDYPSTPSYAQGYGARDQQNLSYLPPTYPTQYLQAAPSQQGQMGQMASHYDTSMSAYGANSSIPPFNSSALAAGVPPPLPIFQGWNQDPSFLLPPYTTPNNGTQYSGYTHAGQHSMPSSYTPSSQPTYQQQVPGAKPSDQGDLDEGEFEDHSNTTHTPPSAAYGTSQYRDNGGTGYVDTAQRAVHTRPRDYSPQHSVYSANKFDYRRQNSGSFSPYIPQVAADAASPAQDSTNGTTPNQYVWSRNAAGSSSRTRTQTNGCHASQKPDDIGPLPVLPVPSASGQMESTKNGRSVIESRKKAQAAILNLWPYDVRYQTYVDEGFSKEVVGSLFDELKMTRNSAKSINEASAHGGNSVSFNSNSQLGQEHTPSVSSTAGLASNKTENAVLGKDRISLSSLGKNPPSANSSGIENLISTKAVTAPTKPAEMTEKEKTLQFKMEALRKSRKERAQKAAAKTVNKPLSVGLDTSLPQADPSKPSPSHLSASTASPLPLATSSLPIAQSQLNKPSTNVQQQTPLIPGLFLASTSRSAPSTSLSTIASSTPNNIRKRPVAADFDEATPISTPFKRPFGHSGAAQRLVITVSDDEADSGDEDVAMDLESQATQDSPTQTVEKMSDQRSAAVQNLPLTDFPPRKPFTPPPISSAANTPPLQGLPNPAGRLTIVQTEMENLKQQIAVREARRKTKQSSSGSHTPQVLEANGSSTNLATPPAVIIASKFESSIKMQEMIETANTNVAIDQQRLADAQAAEIKKAAELKKSEDEQKRSRREELAADIPRVDAEVQLNQSRLEELRTEMEKIEESVQKSLEAKRLFTEEMERLGQEADEQLKAQEIKPDNLTKQDSVTNEGSSHSSPSGSVAEASQPPNSAQVDQLSASTATTTVQPPLPGDIAASAETSAGKGDLPTMEIVWTPMANDNDATMDDQNLVSGPIEESSSETLAETNDQKSKDRTATDQALEAALQEAFRADTDSHGQEFDEMDIEDFYAPDPGQLAPQTPTHVCGQTGSSENLPILHRMIPDVTRQESDDYEPPEATPLADEEIALVSPPFSPAPPENVSEVAVDEDLDVDMPDSEPALAPDDVEQGHSGENLTSMNASLPRVVEVRADAIDKPESFTPYESPLKQFRAYLFHPTFKQHISGGLKSKTYSHKIDIMTEFCRFELAGGVCNDPTCDSQHFRDIDLLDDAVLSALGSPNEFKGEQRDRFCQGLRRVLMDLRVRKIKDFEVIASEIIAHRANFLGDKSKVLASLEGTSI